VWQPTICHCELVREINVKRGSCAFTFINKNLKKGVKLKNCKRRKEK